MSTRLSTASRNPIDYFRILPFDILSIFYYSVARLSVQKKRKAEVYAPLRGIIENLKNIKTHKGNFAINENKD